LSIEDEFKKNNYLISNENERVNTNEINRVFDGSGAKVIMLKTFMLLVLL
jgi:hypothetical protein